MAHDLKRAVAARNAADRRVRILTAAAVAAGVALTAAFTSLAAGTTHLKKVVHRTVRTAKPVVAPPPKLVPAHTNAPPPAPAPAPTPVPSPGPAVVVSGGS